MIVARSSWLVHQPGAQRRLRMYCFPYAGGSASAFLPWQSELPPEVEICSVQLPGRGSRLHEAPFTSLNILARELADVIAGQPRMPFTFFGHSMGALLAFEVARSLVLRHLPMPIMLFASGSDAPSRRNKVRNLHELDDASLIAELQDFNGTPIELLQNPEMMALALPAVRGDFAMVATYKYRRALMLSLPLIVLAGTLDKHCEAANVEAWPEETTGPCHIHWFEGDHFFIRSNETQVLACLRSYLEGPLR